jgi:hypothetical protein
VKPKDINRGVQDLHSFPGYNEGFRSRERYPMPHPIDPSQLQPLDGSQSQVPSQNRLHVVIPNRKGAFKKLQELEIRKKYNDQLSMQNLNYSEGVEVKRKPSNSSKRIDLTPETKNPIRMIQDELSGTIQHTPSPPPHDIHVDPDEKQGVKCSFDKPCAWTFDKDVPDGSNFYVTNGIELSNQNMTGE